MQSPMAPNPPADGHPAPGSRAGDRYERQALFAPLGRAGDARLREATVLVVGCGALGSHAAEILCRAGIGTLRLVDRDVVEWTNLHRQIGFAEEDARRGAPKATALAAHLGRANSGVQIDPRVGDFNPRSAGDLTAGADLILDGTDNLPTRFLINDLALELDIPWVYGGAVGDEAHAQIFLPGAGPCLRCLLPDLPPAGSLPTCDTAGVIGPAPAAAAAFEASLALRCLAAGREAAGPLAGIWVRLRLWEIGATTSRCRRDPQCPACHHGRRDHLRGECADATRVLCGRNAVQILPAATFQLSGVDMDSLERRLAGCGEVERSPFLLRFRPAVATSRLTIFADGRAIVEGTTDRDVARSLYDRYVGQ